MGASKNMLFDDQQNDLASVFKALAHPARIAILQELLKRNSCVCGELVDVLPLSQATVSQHLKELKQMNILQGEIEGKRVCYCINTETWARISKDIAGFFEQINQNNNCC
jgi:DNA-binding transcriptional ArsR family regulator